MYRTLERLDCAEHECADQERKAIINAHDPHGADHFRGRPFQQFRASGLCGV